MKYFGKKNFKDWVFLPVPPKYFVILSQCHVFSSLQNAVNLNKSKILSSDKGLGLKPSHYNTYLPKGPKGPRSRTLPFLVHGALLKPAIIQTSIFTIVSGRVGSLASLHLQEEKNAI